MSVEKLERVIWRLRKTRTDTRYFSYKELRVAVIKEIGYDERTFQRVLKALKRVGYIRTMTKHRFQVTDEDLQ